jgi:hypothetical protein
VIHPVHFNWVGPATTNDYCLRTAVIAASSSHGGNLPKRSRPRKQLGFDGRADGLGTDPPNDNSQSSELSVNP